MLEHKTFAIKRAEFKADGDGPGELTGWGATFGNVDEGGDVIIKGAFTDALPAFLERGFVPVGHDWLGLPVATIADAKEEDDGLWFSAEFHTTQAAQDARTVVRERVERGKFVGLSIGFLPDYEDGVEFRDDGVRVISKVKDLAEISIVTVPMNRMAGVADVKADLGAGLSYEQHGERVLAAVAQFTTRTADRAGYRIKEGRVLSAANRTRLGDIRDGMRSAAKELDAILADTDPDREKASPVDVYRWKLRTHAIGAVLAEVG